MTSPRILSLVRNLFATKENEGPNYLPWSTAFAGTKRCTSPAFGLIGGTLV